MKVIDKKKGLKYLFYFLIFAISFFIGYKYFIYKQTQSKLPQYSLSEDLKEMIDNKQASRQALKNTQKKTLGLGTLAVAFKNKELGAIHDINTISLQNSYAFFVSDNSPAYNYGDYDVSSRTNEAVFISSNAGSDLNASSSKIYIGNVYGVKLPNRHDAKVFSSSTLENKHGLSLSPRAKRLLFVAKTDNGKEGIFLVGRGSDAAEFILDGRAAEWIDENQFVYLNDHSLSLYNTENKKDYKLWVFEGKEDAPDYLSVSKDHKIVAVHLPKYNRISIFSIKRHGKQIALENLSSIEGGNYGFVLSPNAKFLALLQKDGNGNKAIKIYDIKSGEKLKSIFDNAKAFEFYNADSVKLVTWF